MGLLTGPLGLFTYITSEALFVFYQRKQWQRLDARQVAGGDGSGDVAGAGGQPCRQAAWRAFCNVLQGQDQLGLDAGAWLRQWFKQAELHSLRRGNVAEFLAELCWGSSR